jgi:hypothetical protein
MRIIRLLQFRTVLPFALAAWLLPLVHPYSHGHAPHPVAGYRLAAPDHDHAGHKVYAHNDALCQVCQSFRKLTAAAGKATAVPGRPIPLGDACAQAALPVRHAADTHRPIRAPPA